MFDEDGSSVPVRSAAVTKERFAEFYGVPLDRVVGYGIREALRYGLSKEDAEEVAADALERMIRALQNDDRKRSTFAFAATCVRRLSIDRLRRLHAQKRGEEEPFGDAAEWSADPLAQLPEDAAEHAELVQVVDDSIARLPEGQRLAMERAFDPQAMDFHRFAQQEIAAMLGISTAAVKARVNEGLTNLARMLSDLGYGPTAPNGEETER